ncbi:hypothetical protein SUGI_0258920 [Cryptomeria japonica]|uniref:uncharacterized protein LOC131044741 n=1 Tax=Cryptomeria japonica TaxID=3369 RepID=UPI002408C58D|nr:uncharacterized protein LOC131044741 [Cryptomeria japonica]GLJ15734.1 hypothetical protein SUGI_0258920 [Cryptomeria japonica]
MENEFVTPAKQSATAVHSCYAPVASDGKTPSADVTKTPCALTEQQSNIMKPDKEEGQEEEEQGKTGRHPERVIVPLHQQKKLWSMDGRYMSPTDRIMSPVTQVLLARNKKFPLPPSKVLDGTCNDSEPSAL